MLTSHKVSSVLPFQPERQAVMGQEAPAEGKENAFSDVIASLFMNQGGSTPLKEAGAQVSNSALTQMDLNALKLSDLKEMAMNQTLPQELEALAEVDVQTVESMLSGSGITIDEIQSMSLKDLAELFVNTVPGEMDQDFTLVGIDAAKGFGFEVSEPAKKMGAKAGDALEKMGVDVAEPQSYDDYVISHIPAVAEAKTTHSGQNVVQTIQPSLSGSAQSNYQTNWGTASQAAENALSGNGQSSQNNSAFSQNQQGHFAQQQMMQMQEQRNQAIQQQMALKTADEQLLKADSREGQGLLGTGFSTGERSVQLPLGLQTINVPVKSQQWAQAFGHRVTFMANNHIQQAQISLNPEKLGPIQIKLQIDRDQQVHVAMVAQNGTTREAIDSAMPRLREMLEQSGLNLASVDVSDQKQFAEQNKNSEEAGTVQSQLSNDLDSVEEEVVTSQAIVSDNIVDYYA